MSFVCVLHFIMSSCALHCIHVRLMHPSIFPVVRFAIRHSYALRRPPFVPHCERVLNILGMDQVLSSGLGLLPVDRLSSFVSFGLRLTLQRLTEGPKRPCVCCSPTPPILAQNPTKHAPSSRAFNHDRVAENRTSFGLSELHLCL